MTTTEKAASPQQAGEQRMIFFSQALREALAEEMERDPTVFVYGEEVGVWGGAYNVTEGFLDKFGPERIIDTPISEALIGGAAVGASITGSRPIAEFMYQDFMGIAMDQIVNQAAKNRYMFGGKNALPIVYRAACGAGISNAAQHTQSLEAWFTHVPGLKVVLPSNAYDAKGLLKSAIRDDNVVLFFEHKGLYRQGYATSKEPDENYCLDFGVGSIAQEGSDLTIVTWGSLVQKSIDATRATDHHVEIIDLRTLYPLDLDIIIQSLEKTNRVIVVHEDNLTGGFGGEIVSLINEHAFELLDAPVKRVASKDVPIAYSDILEDQILVQTDWIVDMINEIIEY